MLSNQNPNASQVPANQQVSEVTTQVAVPPGYGLVKLPEQTPRAKRVDDETFCKTYVEMATKGRTTDEIADALGMNVLSVISRASATRKRFGDANVSFPIAHRKSGGGRKTTKMTPDALRSFINSLNA